MIIIAGTIDIADASQRDACIAASLPHQMATRAEEPGCRAYCFGADPGVAGRIQVYELWDDEPSLAAHFEHANYTEMRSTLGGFGPLVADNRKFRCDLAEPVYDQTRTPRADFFTASAP